MALQKQIIQMAVQGGLDTKSDDKNVLPTNFLELENVVYTKTGSFTKRYGYERITHDTLDGGEILSGNAITNFKDELLEYSTQRLYSFSEAENKWVDKGNTKFALASDYSVASTGDKLTNPCHSNLNNLTCYVYEKSPTVGSTNVEYRVVDNITGSVLATGEISGATLPKVVTLNGKFFIFTKEIGVFKGRTISYSTPTSISVPFNVVAGPVFDCVVIGNNIHFASPQAVSGVQIGHVQFDTTVVGPIVISPGTAFTTVSVSDENGNVRYAYGTSAAATAYTALYNSNLGVLHAPVALAGFTSPLINISAIQDPADAFASYIYCTDYVGASYTTVKKVHVDVNGTLGATSQVLMTSTLQSKIAVFDEQLYFVVAPYNNGYAFSTGYLYSDAGDFLTRASPQIFVVNSTGMLPSLIVENQEICFSGASLAEVQRIDTALQSSTTVRKYCADFSQITNYFDATLGDNLHIAGGILKMYDGNRVVEHGFMEPPPAPIFVSETGVGAVLEPGTYFYVAVYSWRDKWGQLHRSAPSPSLKYTIPAGPNMRPTIRVATTSYTLKEDVEIEIYRTEANGTTFYNKAYNFSDRIMNDPSVPYIDFDDTLHDDFLIENEILYTTGGTLENIIADSSKHITTYKNRVFLLLSDGKTIEYSKLREQNGPVEFNDNLKIVLDDFGGPGVCLGVLDDHVIIFKERAIYALTGEGPNNLGELDDFRAPYLITSDAGCIDPNSVVVTPMGLMFKSEKGIYLLQRGLSVQYIGAAVEKYNDATVTAATLLSTTNQVRFTLETGIALVYDYYHEHWSTFTNVSAVDATIYKGVYTYLNSLGYVFQEQIGSYSDGGSFIKMRVVSAWIHLADVQGFERFYKLLLLGKYLSKHKFKVYFSYDYNPAWVNEVEVDPSQLLDNSFYGNDNYGDETPYGGEFPLYQWRIFPKRQKCQAFRFMIEDFKVDENGASFSLSNFAAEVGIKKGLAKKTAVTSFGAE